MRLSMKRRDFLRNVAKAGLLIPFANSVLTRSSYAAIEPGQGRIIFLTYPNGTSIGRASTSRIKQWHSPTSAGASNGLFDLPESCALAPLNPHKTDVTLLRNLHLRHNGTGAHAEITSRLLTGGVPADHLSIDTWLTNEFNKVTVMPSGHYSGGVFSNTQTDLHYLTRNEVGQPVSQEQNPYAMYSKIKSVIDQNNNPENQQDLAMLDSIERNIEELLALQLNQTDRQKIEVHERELNLYKQRLQVTIGGCGNLSQPHQYTADELKNMTLSPQMCREHIDLIVAAMSCNLTRVATLSIGSSEGDFPLSWINYDDDIAGSTSPNSPPQSYAWYSHGVSHYDQDGGPLLQHNRWYVEQAAYLIQKLKDASMLNDTLVVVCSEYSDGRHSGCGDEGENCYLSNDAGFFLAGGSNFIQTGKIIDCEENNHASLWRDIAQGLGFSLDKFGISLDTPIPGLLQI